jgi:uncharacterized membrane protein
MMSQLRQLACILAIASGALALQSAPSRAQFAVCNQTFDVVNVAIGLFDENAFRTRGWWTIGPNQCANVIDSELRARYVYVFAQDVFGKTILTGSAPLCVAPERFEIVGESDCLVRGFIEARFHEVDTQKTERWTFFLNPPPS